jgi:hypothetical protein
MLVCGQREAIADETCLIPKPLYFPEIHKSGLFSEDNLRRAGQEISWLLWKHVPWFRHYVASLSL